MKSKKIIRVLAVVFALFLLLSLVPQTARAAEAEPAAQTAQLDGESQVKKTKALAAAFVIGIPAAVGAISMGWAITKSVDGIARQPEADGKIRTSLMLGLVFVETAIIYALIVSILIVFVL